MSVNKTCVYTFDQLEVLNAQEDDFWSNGDEIYLVYVGFRSRTATKGSTITTINAFGSYQWAKHVDQGAKRVIPQSMGRVAIPVSITDMADVLESGTNHTPLTADVVGVVGLAMESDDTPWSTINSMMSQFRGAVQNTVADIVENLPADLTNVKVDQLAANVHGASDKIKKAMKLSLGQKIALFLTSAGDPDDVVQDSEQFNVCFDLGTLNFINAFRGPDKKVAIPNILTPQPFALTYQNTGVNYRVTGRITLE